MGRLYQATDQLESLPPEELRDYLSRMKHGRMTICEECGREYPTIRLVSVTCSRECMFKRNSRLSKDKPRVFHRNDPDKIGKGQLRVYARRTYLDQCAICGWNEDTCDVCHVLSVSKGGTNTVDNVVMLCPNHHRLFDSGKINPQEVLAARPRILREVS